MWSNIFMVTLATTKAGVAGEKEQKGWPWSPGDGRNTSLRRAGFSPNRTEPRVPATAQKMAWISGLTHHPGTHRLFSQETNDKLRREGIRVVLKKKCLYRARHPVSIERAFAGWTICRQPIHTLPSPQSSNTNVQSTVQQHWCVSRA